MNIDQKIKKINNLYKNITEHKALWRAITKWEQEEAEREDSELTRADDNSQLPIIERRIDKDTRQLKELINDDPPESFTTTSEFKSHVEWHLLKIENIINLLPDKGDKCENSQKICLHNALGEFMKNVNGLEQSDLEVF